MKISIVDDSAFQRNHVKRTLESWGHTVNSYSSASEFLAKTDFSMIELLITDLLMPGMDGRELVEEVRKRQCQIPIVVLTADVQSTAKKECLDSGANDVIHKPPTDDKLREIVQRFGREKVA